MIKPINQIHFKLKNSLSNKKDYNKNKNNMYKIKKQKRKHRKQLLRKQKSNNNMSSLVK